MEQAEMKNVLIVGYFWPYVYGGHRISGLIKYLNKYGWHPIILTRVLNKDILDIDVTATVIEVEYKGDIFRFIRPFVKLLLGAKSKDEGLKAKVKSKTGSKKEGGLIDKSFNLFQEIFGYPDVEKSWIKPALKKANELIELGGIDLILSEWPVASHIIAHELKKQHNIPWIADFTDLWSQNHNYLFSEFRRHFDTNLEKKTLRNADLLVTVSDPWAEKLRFLHGDKVVSIQHGFSPEQLNSSGYKLINKFVITYTGRIYSEFQNPKPFFEVLSDLLVNKIINRSDILVRFYGDQDEWIYQLVSQMGLSDVVEMKSRVDKSEIVPIQRESQLLLLLALDGKEHLGCYTSKIYDYMAALRPILSYGGDANDVIPVLIENTNIGHHATSKKELEKIITNYYMEFKSNGYVKSNSDIKKVECHNHNEMTKSFVKNMERLIDN